MNRKLLSILMVTALIFFGMCSAIAEELPTEMEWEPISEERYEEIAARDLTFGAIWLNLEHATYQTIARSAREYCESLGIKLIEVDSKADQGLGTSAMENFIAQKVDGIIYGVTEGTAAAYDVLDAQAAGIPVVVCGIYQNRDIASCPFTGSKNYNASFVAGVTAGNYWIEHFGEDVLAKVCIINAPDLQPVCSDRTNGFKDGLTSVLTDVEFVEEIDGKAVQETSMDVTSDFIQRHPECNMFYGFNGVSALGALSALEDAGRGTIDQNLLISHDGSEAELLKMADPQSALKVAVGNSGATTGKVQVDTLLHIIFGDFPMATQTSIYSPSHSLTFDDLEAAQAFLAREYFIETDLLSIAG